MGHVQARTETTRNHFAGRPEWPPERHRLAWHVIVSDDLQAVAALAPYRDALAGLGHLSPVADDRFHITGPALGFRDEVPSGATHRVVDLVRARLAAVPSFRVTFAPPVVMEDMVTMAVRDDGPLQDVRQQVRAGITEAGLQPPDGEGWVPHVSLAYATGAGPAATVTAALERVATGPVTLRVQGFTLIALRRVPPTYDWDVIAPAPLRPPS